MASLRISRHASFADQSADLRIILALQQGMKQESRWCMRPVTGTNTNLEVLIGKKTNPKQVQNKEMNAVVMFSGIPSQKKTLTIFPHQICFSALAYWCWWPPVQTMMVMAPTLIRESSRQPLILASIRGGSTTQSLFYKAPKSKSVQATAL